jgi:hypothetical protein
MADEFPTRTPGEILRTAREERGADLAAAHEGTKIPVRLLEALERDEYHKLSGPLYVKSFLRNYAGWLGLDPEEILRVYELATGRPEVTPAGQEMVWTEEEVAVTRVGGGWQRPALWIGGAVLLAAVLIVLSVLLPGGRDDPGDRAAGDAVRAEGPATAAVTTGTDSAAVAPGGVADAAAEGGEPGTLPPAPRGDTSLRFAGGTTYPLVLRVTVPEPVNCTVRRDGEAAAVPVIWPQDPAPPPAYNFRHGVAYAVRGGYAIYWGAEDNFTLTLDRLAGAEVTLNGQPQPISRWRPGEPVVLDGFAATDGE